MKLRFLKSCVFAGADRKPGEIIDAAPSPSASIVTGAGQAEWLKDEPFGDSEQSPEPPETPVQREKTPDTDGNASEQKTPAKTARKAKKK